MALRKRRLYYRDFWALRDINLEIPKGTTFGIIGQNGSGKSTLLQIITGILRPTAGTFKVEGRISALLELGAGFNAEFTGRENVYMQGSVMGISQKEMEERFDEIADFADIGDFIDQPAKTYSSGMYVRLAFATAINVEPDLLVIDEALAVGDDMFRRRCYGKLEEFQNQGKTIVFVSHSLSTVTNICSHAMLLDKGRIVETGKPKDVVNIYSKMSADREIEYARRLRGDADSVDNETQIKKSNQSESEFRYGTSEAEILDCRILNRDGEETTLIESGERYIIRIVTRFNKEVSDPIIGINIKTIDGVLVFGINTLKSGSPVGEVNSGDVVSVDFEVDLNLFRGSYILSAGVIEVASSSIIPLDRRWDLIVLKVIDKDNFWGLTTLTNSVHVKRSSEK